MNRKNFTRIGAITLTVSLVMFNNSFTLAQNNKNESEATETIEELIVNSKRPTPFQPLVRVVSVFHKEDIERAAVQNIQDLLKFVQGADLRSRGSEGVQADLNILGGTFDQTVIMINGVNFTDPQTGHHSLNIPIIISQIERVELLHGPGAWSQGTVAYSGAINIITKTPSKTNLQVNLSGGEHRLFNSNINTGFITRSKEREGILFKKWDISGQVGAGLSSSDGYTQNTDFDITNFYSNIVLENKSGHSIHLQAGYQQKSFGANSFYSISFPDQFESTKLFLTSAKYLFERDRWQFSGTVYQRRHHDRFELFRKESPDWYSGHNYHMNNIVGINANMAYKWARVGSTVVGVDFRYEHIYSTVLGDQMNNPNRVSIPKEGGLYFTHSKKREIPALYLRHILQLERWRFTAGLMITSTYNSGESKDYRARVYAGLSTTYQITPYLEANGWINNSYRNPTFTDLYYKSPTQTGNTLLKPEEAVAAQVGLKLTKHKLKASLSGFYRYGYSIVDWTRESGSEQWSASNITNIASTGIDMYIQYDLSKSYINKIGVAYSWMNVEKKSDGLHSLYATDYLKHKVAANIEHMIISKLSARWDLLYQKREGTFLNRDNFETPYKGFFLAHLKIIWNGKVAKPFIEATNLFNTKYELIGNLPQPLRWIKAGITINI